MGRPALQIPAHPPSMAPSEGRASQSPRSAPKPLKTYNPECEASDACYADVADELL